MKRSKITLQSGKTYTYSGTEGAYTVILGEIAAGDAPASSGSAAPVISVDDGPPSNSLTGSVTTYIDKSSKKIYVRSGGTWDSGTSMTGSAGATGATGSTGATGAAGSRGSDGKSVRFGSGAPASGLGADDEVYIDTSNFRIHTKSAGSWSGGSLFKGGDGTNGVDGSSIRFGSGAPASGLGSNNDVYIDLSDFKIHTKSAGSWSGGSVFSGSKGLDGSNGSNGKSVLFGNGAPASGLGADDETYIDLDNFTIHTKSAGSWSGGSLFKGSDGSNGSNGSNGADGKSVRFGSGAPASGLGADNEVYIDTSSFKIHTKTSGTWSAGSLFKGDTGAGVQVYSVALGASNSSSNVELGVALTGMQFQDVLTNEGSILTASTSGGVTTLTITNTGRYKFDLQASVKATRGSLAYAPTVTAQIYNVTANSNLISGSLLLSPGDGTPDTDVIELKRIFRVGAGTQIRVRAKTDNAGSVAAQKSYLVLSDKGSSDTVDDTILTITKL